ncbi:MAG: glutamine-hydrolyzing carbamoyl-phosphate synthase small subunit [Clostridia bacterium]|nr:glutamine-hydrolyzing carbamoyl-phosphate synthase small subunit [Clostridia bacterium]
MEKKGYLLLADGQLYEGVLRGAQKDAAGEAVFLTSVVGYMDTLTDPAYAGQIVIQTFPQIGNYGVVPMPEGTPAPSLSGYVCRELCDAPCNFRCQGTLNDYLIENGIVCLTDVDTRALTRRLRDKGVMNAAILTEKPADIAAAAAELAAQVIPAETATGVEDIIPAEKPGKYSVVLWDLGAKADTVQQLEKRGCAVTLVPANVTAEAIAALNPDGVVITNGAGNPEDCADVSDEITKLLGDKHLPVMGIGLGHQLLAMSQGAEICKLTSGHRGGNQPIEDVKTGACYITSQNHGYEVDRESLPENASLRYVNRNDGSCEGIDYLDMPVFSVQFQPALTGGLFGGAKIGTHTLFDRFTALMGGNKECR